MEPKLPTPNSAPEFYSPEPKKDSSERISDILNEVDAQEYSQERESQPSPVVPDPVMYAQPTVPVLPVPDDTSSHLADDTVLIASDDDLIERTWVDKAKNIVSATKNDPYKQEEEVSKLQATYLLKRYGKKVKISSEE